MFGEDGTDDARETWHDVCKCRTTMSNVHRALLDGKLFLGSQFVLAGFLPLAYWVLSVSFIVSIFMALPILIITLMVLQLKKMCTEFLDMFFNNRQTGAVVWLGNWIDKQIPTAGKCIYGTLFWCAVPFLSFCNLSAFVLYHKVCWCTTQCVVG